MKPSSATRQPEGSISATGQAPEPTTHEPPAVSLQVCVADAQGLKLMRGGEIRLVLTLRAADDPEGVGFGAKVTPWQAVPETEAPRWRAREAIFAVPAERGSQPDFIESAYLHIALMQRGAVSSSTGSTGAVAAQAAHVGLGYLSLGAALGALQETTSAFLGESRDRGEAIGVLKLPVGKQLVRGDCGSDGASWAHLHEEQSDGVGRLRGALLLELATAHNLPHSRPPVPLAGLPPTQASQAPQALPDAPQQHPLPQPPSPGRATPGDGTDSPLAVVGSAPLAGEASPRAPEAASDVADSCKEAAGGSTNMSPRNIDALSDSSTSAEDATSNVSAHRGSTASSATSASATRVDSTSASASATTGQSGEGERPALRPVPAAQWAAAIERSTLGDGQGEAFVASQWVLPGQGHAVKGAFDTGGPFNIFTINNPAASGIDAQDGRGGGDPKGTFESSELKDLFQSLSSRPTKQMRSLKERMRMMVSPEVRNQRQEVRKWRQRHEIFCVLNEIEQRLSEVMGLLRQAAASMRRFRESHTMLSDVLRLSAFLRDAGLYYRSEAEVPEHVENHLGELERIADDFRSISLDEDLGGDTTALEPGDGDAAARPAREHLELLRASEDLQVDVAVLLESALMTAQQALAEYKKMHCRLELLATEYAPSIRFELEATRPVFLPLIMDSKSTQVAAAAVPDQAVQWALDFSELVGTSSQGLEGLVQALGNRQKQLRTCAAELREHILRRVASIP